MQVTQKNILFWNNSLTVKISFNYGKKELYEWTFEYLIYELIEISSSVAFTRGCELWIDNLKFRIRCQDQKWKKKQKKRELGRIYNSWRNVWIHGKKSFLITSTTTVKLSERGKMWKTQCSNAIYT